MAAAAVAASRTPNRMLRRIRRRLESERASVYLEYALVTSITLGLAALMLNPDSWLFKGLGLDYAFREMMIKLPIF